MLFRTTAILLASFASRASAQNTLPCAGSPCSGARCVSLSMETEPRYECLCDRGMIPTANEDVCIPGQAYDHNGDEDFDLCDTDRCDPDSTCDATLGYVRCFCDDGPRAPIHQGVECDTNSGLDWDLDEETMDDPCSVENNFCDPNAVCVLREDVTLAECECPDVGSEPGPVLLPGFKCPHGSAPAEVNTEVCKLDHCDTKSECRANERTGRAECVCPAPKNGSGEGPIMRPFYSCPPAKSTVTVTVDEDINDGTVDGTDPCLKDNGMCGVHLECASRLDAMNTLIAECICPGGTTISPGPNSSCGGGIRGQNPPPSPPGDGEDLGNASPPVDKNPPAIACAFGMCPMTAPCTHIEVDGTDVPMCKCTNSIFVSPHESCPSTPVDHPETHLSCDTVECKDDSECVIVTDGSTEKAMCKCPGTDAILIQPHFGTCVDLCAYKGSDRYPCGYGTSCSMDAGWAQCKCGDMSLLHYENCD